MALRNIVTEGDETLRKICKPVKEITPRTLQLLDDMAETMRDAQGVGLAAPQVGILRRICVVECEPGVLYELINPEIVESEGDQFGPEGCLSVPGKVGDVHRPDKVKVKALDRNGDEQEYEAEGFLARAFCHEIDHLNGVLYVDTAEDLRYVPEEGEEEEETEEGEAPEEAEE